MEMVQYGTRAKKSYRAVAHPQKIGLELGYV